MPTRPVPPLAEVFESLARLEPEVAVDLIDSGAFDEALLAPAGQKSPVSSEVYAELNPFSHDDWLRRHGR